MGQKWAWWLFSSLVLVVLFYPQDLTIVPAYHVKLVDQFGAPLAQTGVSELWQQTSAQRHENIEQVMTNDQGDVDLPPRALRSPLAVRMVGCLAYLSREGLAAICGNRYSISAAGDLKELQRTETVTGILNKHYSLVLTLKQCDPNEPSLC
ncbi:hypothetical protein [Alloacidobacterium sp.]|uniref:hypothetical protein n=1 Tax=Alloacidobacterium sp. TaxID=2951999 RepID=UPI002D4E0B76|nr:hypothetical protein [Alloacidobacterium sp.]HYK37722.1 hypothetical protein [Alloacidobacterium sp.]